WTVFRGVHAIQPGCFAVWRDGALRHGRYYELEYPEAGEETPDAIPALDILLESSVALRLRSDVPVGGYLSGGLDSSISCALAARESPFPLRTFSVTFDDPQLDEREFQLLVAEQLDSHHFVRAIGLGDVAAAATSGGARFLRPGRPTIPCSRICRGFCSRRGSRTSIQQTWWRRSPRPIPWMTCGRACRLRSRPGRRSTAPHTSRW